MSVRHSKNIALAAFTGALCAAAVAGASAQPPQEQRTPFGLGARHPLKTVLPPDHPLAKGPADYKDFKPIVLPDKPQSAQPDSPEGWTEVEYSVADRKERRGKSAKTRPNLSKMPKHNFGLDQKMLLEPQKVSSRTVFEMDRKLISNTTLYPWRTACKLFMKFPNGNYIGSGIMIGGKYVLTAGHCVYYAPAGGWAQSIEVIPGWVGTTNYKPFGSAYMTHCQSFTGWTVSGNYEHDVAIIRMDRYIGYSSGWLSYWNYPSNVGATMYTAGYPSDLAGGLRMYYDYDAVLSENTNVVRYKADTYKGQSGSGVWRYSSSTPYIIAIHANGFPTTNVGTRLNGTRISSFNAYMAASP